MNEEEDEYYPSEIKTKGKDIEDELKDKIKVREKTKTVKKEPILPLLDNLYKRLKELNLDIDYQLNLLERNNKEFLSFVQEYPGASSWEIIRPLKNRNENLDVLNRKIDSKFEAAMETILEMIEIVREEYEYREGDFYPDFMIWKHSGLKDKITKEEQNKFIRLLGLKDDLISLKVNNESTITAHFFIETTHKNLKFVKKLK